MRWRWDGRCKEEGGWGWYHGGRGSEARIWDWSEAREVVRWARRWRVCSKDLIVAGGRVGGDGGRVVAIAVSFGAERRVWSRMAGIGVI